MRVIDTHCHLEDIRDLDGALERAREAGVEAIVAVGVNLESNRKILNIYRSLAGRKEPPKIYPSCGIHPGDINAPEPSSALKLIEENIDSLVAIGEIGLDHWYKEARKEGDARRLQEDIFIKQLAIAAKHDKPVIVHSRGAWDMSLDRVRKKLVKKAVFHWYSGPVNILEEILGCGYLISASPSLEYSREHREAVKTAPLGKILIETDSPVTYKPETGNYRSEPKDVIRTLKALAELKGLKIEDVAQKTTDNAVRFFGLN